MNLEIPEGYDEAVENALMLAGDVEGQLKDSEVRMLFLFGACPTAEGEVLEIGSFLGKSTVVLAKAAELAGPGGIVSVDPLNSPSETDPDLGEEASGRRRFDENLRKSGVTERVEFHQMTSGELLPDWERKIRFLWIDGDHTYSGTKPDFDMFSPFMAEGAMVAFHDVMHRFDGPIRVFMEDVLGSDSFGAAGVTGSIGWAQYLGPGGAGNKFRQGRLRLRRKLGRMLPYHLQRKEQLEGFGKHLYRFWKSLVPHGDLHPGKWLSAVQRRH